jgi:hypothetical protein
MPYFLWPLLCFCDGKDDCKRAEAMKYLHTMVRITDPDASLAFFCDALGLTLLKRYDNCFNAARP